MGNTSSRPPLECTEVVLASLSSQNVKKLNQMAYPNFFEAASVSLAQQSELPKSQKRSASVGQISNASSNSAKTKGRRKWSSSSETTSSRGTSTTLTNSPTSTETRRVIDLTANPNVNTKIDFEVISGRRYQYSPGTHFFLPCDDEEADRLVIMHFLIKYAFSGNVVAPVIDNLRLKIEENKGYRPKVLDVGCGPGTWILEMATEFPNSEFHGIDLRTMFPSSIKPQNTHFLQHDYFKNLPYADESFEFVRMRSMLGFTTHTQLLHLLSEIQRVLKPLGFIEILDVEYRVQRPGPICEAFLNQQLHNTMQKKGIEFMASHHLSTLLMARPADGGFVDVHQRKVTVPIGWGGQLGEVHAQNLCSLLQSIHPEMKKDICANGGDGISSIDELITKAIEECTAMQSHMNWFVCYGQKPAKNIFSVTPPSSIKNLIPTGYPKMITPIASPNNSSFDINDYYQQQEHNWDSINDFVDGYVD